MTGLEIITKFENMVDDTLDSEFAYQLLNDAKDEVESMQDWEVLKKETTYSVTGSYSYTSALGSLPTRFNLPLKMVESSSNIDYHKVNFEDLFAKTNDAFGYFIDYAEDNIHLCGENHGAKTMYLYYTTYSADLEAASEWVFPSRFHSIIPLKMAELYYAADSGEHSRSWDEKWAVQFERQLNRMRTWDNRLKSKTKRPRSYGVNPKGVNL
jgi:hypothetical protein